MFQTFVINLNKDTDRLKFMESQLREQGISYSRQAGIDGRRYSPSSEEYSEDLARKNNGRALLPGEIGCALSHRMILERVVKEKINFCLVLEDDIALPKDFRKVIIDVMEKNQDGKKWEYLLFDYPPVGIPFLSLWSKGVLQNYNELSTTQEKMRFITFHIVKAFFIFPLSLFELVREQRRRSKPGPVRFYRPVFFAGAYLITYQGAVKLLALATPVRYTADQLPNEARKISNLKFRCYSPRIVDQVRSKFGSSILGLTGEQVSHMYPTMR